MEFPPVITKPCSSREAEKQTADIGLEDQRILQQKIESQIYSRRWHMEFGRLGRGGELLILYFTR